MLTTPIRDAGLFLDVKDAFSMGHTRGEAAARVLDRIRAERAGFVVLNFHEIDAVPSECLRLLDSMLDDGSSDVRIILTETSHEIRRTFVDSGLLSPMVLDRPGCDLPSITLRPL